MANELILVVLKVMAIEISFELIKQLCVLQNIFSEMKKIVISISFFVETDF